ncbi:Arm DNA-binding domain-containing protein [Synechococcus sp. GFB01]|uniref:Arm DNA-binding domain-containing protein n=1 Tax=Synechococcus sp. GFB01 TaxID=1662190 RepID=UPI00090817DE
MNLNDAQIRSLQPGDRRQNKSVGDSLFLVIEPTKAGGGKSFEGRMRFPSGRGGKQISVRIGVYGRGLGRYTLSEARVEWTRIKNWSRTKDALSNKPA